MIFIGGTGRSGTTVLTKILGRHPDLYMFPTEIRFIPDPDGLVSLKSALVDNWSYFQADLAIERFGALMRMLSKPYSSRYPNSRLGGAVGEDFLIGGTDSYLREFYGDSFKDAWGRRAIVSVPKDWSRRRGDIRMADISRVCTRGTEMFL